MKNETARQEIESLDYYMQNHTNDYSEESHTAMMMAIQALEQQPSERLKGKWITWKEAGNYIPSETRFECSVCHDAAQTLCNGLDLLSPYCPNCGSYNGGEEDD